MKDTFPELEKIWKDRKIYELRIPKLAETIKDVHRLNADAIFLTQTSAVGYGWIIKEAYKKTRPYKPIPKFLTINVKSIRHNLSSKNKEQLYDRRYARGEIHPKLKFNLEDLPEFYKLVEDVKKKIRTYDVNGAILVIDEFVDTGGTITVVECIIKKALEDLVKDSQVIALNLDLDRCEGSPWKKKDVYEFERYKGKENIKIVRKNIRFCKELGREIADKII